jgi:rod shape determining protein RodA
MMRSTDRRSRSKFENRRTYQHTDFPLLIVTYMLAIFGVIAISMATFDPDKGTGLSYLNYIINSSSGSWQAIFLIASPAVVAVVAAIPYDIFRARARPLYLIVISMLVLVLGASSINGVSAWLSLWAGRTLQPSEFAKITMILMMAKIMARNEKPMNTLPDFFRVFSVYAIPAVLTLLQGEMGTVIIISFIFFVLAYFGGADWRLLLSMGLIITIAVAVIFVYLVTSTSNTAGSYRVLRILSFLDPQKYYNESGYQILNSQTAIGSGGVKGIGAFVVGSISQLDYVPEDWTDFIFSSIGEAFGFIGCALILLAYLFLILRLLYLARYTNDKFGQIVIIGVMAMMLMHVFENIAMTIGLMPITGIPLPFISYGGSNLITNMIGIALVINVTKNRSSATTMNSQLPNVKRRRNPKPFTS